MDQPNFNIKPAFNIALGYTNSVIYSLWLCSDFARNYDYNGWFFELLNLSRIVSTKMRGNVIHIITGEGKPEDNDEFSVLNKLFDEAERELINKKKSKSLYYKLHKIELFLRKIIKDSGLEMKEIRDDDLLAPEMDWDDNF